jgi:uncharacterized protein
MNAVTKFADSQAERRLHLPAHPISGLAGTSFKHEHLAAILCEGRQHGFFEVHAENYMGAGGVPHHALERIRRDHPISLHGVCMSIGGPQPLDRVHLERFRALIERYEPALVSEHLAWSTHETTYFNDLLPLPYTEATLVRVSDHVDASAGWPLPLSCAGNHGIPVRMCGNRLSRPPRVRLCHAVGSDGTSVHDVHR